VKVTQHLLDDQTVPTQRAQRFLAEHGRRRPPARPGAAEVYQCLDLDGAELAEADGPEGGLERLRSFLAQFGGVSFCQERPGCDGKHTQVYNFDTVVQSGWIRTESGWVAEVGEIEGWPLMLDWSTGRIGIDVFAPETWVAHSALNLVESAALGQSLYLSTVWRKAVMPGHPPGWGLEPEAAAGLAEVVPEAGEASSPWNRWLMDQDVAVHTWQGTYEPSRKVATMAWYRNPQGRRRIEAVAGKLADS
jgi:hypothetical protein